MNTRDKNSLALYGGEPVIDYCFERYNSLGEEERIAVNQVMEKGVLSQYLGCWHDDFYGGEQVRAFEEDCKNFFGVKHAITVNSWTSGLIAAVGALNLDPGDEIIVSPWTMCASATAILHWNAIPVFADIDPGTFNISPESVRANISDKTRAIMAVDIFGQSADIDSLRKIADEYDLKIISDTAQAPGAVYKGKKAGTVADIGGYSLNYHKHIHTGEGGVIVTNDDELAERMRMIRNHGEAVVVDRPELSLVNMLGYNFRLGELECAIGREQLKKLPELVEKRKLLARQLMTGLSGLKGLNLPKTLEGADHVYYVFPMSLDLSIVKADRSLLAEALSAEGVQVATGYQNLHLLPMYQQKIAYGQNGFPWSAEFSRKDIDYGKGICPVAEDLHDKSFIGFGMCVYDLSLKDIELICAAFKKVWQQLVD